MNPGNRIKKTFYAALILAALLAALPVIAAAQGKIVYSSCCDRSVAGANADGIYMINPDGTNRFLLHNETVTSANSTPVLSPDGNKILFISTYLNYTPDNDIFIMGVAGAFPANLTANSGDNVTPAFSPDGSKIAFTSSRDGNYEIYVMNADGTGQTRLTNNGASDPNIQISDAYPSFSPDGNKIVFVSNLDGNLDVYVMNADGTGIQNLTNASGGNNYKPSFSPDGSKIVFYSDRDNYYQIYTMNADGTNQTNVSNSSGMDTEPTFSPDGSRIAFVSNRDLLPVGQIYVMNADGTNQTRITTDFTGGTSPSWSVKPPNAPTLSNAAVPSTVNENGTATLTGNFSSANPGDAFTLGVDWGDGTLGETYSFAAGTSSFNVSHQYLDDSTSAAAGTFNVRVRLTTAGGSDGASLPVTVQNAAPTLNNLSLTSSIVTVGDPTTLSGVINDPGTLDTHRVEIDWGDGSAVQTINFGTGTFSFSALHQYATAGNFTIQITALDDDGGSSSANLGVSVVPPSPPNAPTNLRAATVTANQITLVWNDNSYNETGFIIERCQSSGKCKNFVPIGQTGTGAVTFLNDGLSAGTIYFYRVRAFNAIGNSAFSNTISVKTLRR